MNINMGMIIQLIVVIFGLTNGLPTTQTPITSTENPHLKPKPCGGDIDMGSIPSGEDLLESLSELQPNRNQMKGALEDLKTYMADARIQNPIIRDIKERTAPVIYPSDVFPYPPTNFVSDAIFSELYISFSKAEIYYSKMAGVESSHPDDNDTQILGNMTKVVEAIQNTRCHLQVILRFYERAITSIDFTVDENKIDSSNRSSRYGSHYQIFFMTEVFVNGIADFYDNLN